MSGSHRAILLPTAVLAILAILPASAHAKWNAAGALGWCSTLAESDCPPFLIPPIFCRKINTNILPPTFCRSRCSSIVPPCCWAFSWATARGWRLRGGGAAVGGGTFSISSSPDDALQQASVARATSSCDTPGSAPAGYVSATGERVSQNEFRIDAVAARVDGATQELALLRYAGDPNAYPSGHTVAELVSLGVISQQDVLWVAANDMLTTGQTSIGVTGIPDAELVLNLIADGTSSGNPAGVGACDISSVFPPDPSDPPGASCLMTTQSNCAALGGSFTSGGVCDYVTGVAIPTSSNRLFLQVSPNPALGKINIAFALPASGPATVTVYDIVGRLLWHRVWADLPAGPHQAEWSGLADDGHVVPPGVIYFHLRAGGQTARQTFVRMR